MSDDSPNNTDSPEATNSLETSAKGGSSVLKLIGIAVGLTLVAALVVGGMFWKTLNDNATRENSVIDQGDPAALAEMDALYDEIDAEGDSSATAGDSGEDVPESGRPESEPSDESTEASSEPAANEESGTVSKPETSVSE